ncbi:MAG: hypothetical protein K2M94_04025 [Paramuribaculum sp.]|nr:hypothetical protein [Paramuribaculum sp.]
MKRNYMKCGLTAVIIAVSAAVLHGQNLKKEITVVHDYEPEYITPAPLSIAPGQVKRADTLENLAATYRKLNLPPTSMLTQLRPSAIGDTLFDSSLRGYASLAFMVRYNLAVSAGYKFLDTDRVRLNAWLQYDGKAYKADRVNGILRSNSGALGVQVRYAAGKNSMIDASVAYNFIRRNKVQSEYVGLDDAVINRWFDTDAHKLNFSGLWSATSNKWSYGAGIDYQWSQLPDAVAAGGDINVKGASANENELGIRAYGAYGTGDNSEVRVGARWKYYSTAVDWFDDSRSELEINPVYTGTVDKVDLRLGIRLNAVFGGDSKVLVAPDVNVTWHTGDYVKLYLEADGKVLNNNMTTCYYRAPYTELAYTGGFTSMPIDLKAGVVYGPRDGVRFELFGGYMTSGNMLMPLTYESGYENHGFVSPVTWQKIDIQGWYTGVKAGYNYRHLVDVAADYRISPQDMNRGWIYNTDRARHCLDLRVLVTPIKSVDFTAGWNLRADRAVAMARFEPETSSVTYSLKGLGAVSDVYIKVLYRIDDNWSVMAQGSNLLNHKYDLIGNLPAQGVTGLVGFSYKF